jgi:L-threonylcarbamoyladenylate synthase
LSLLLSPNYIARHLAPGETIAYPTEGVWGLGCRPDDQQAVEKILLLKGRSWTKGLILVASELDQLTPYIASISEQQKLSIREFWPGAVTFLITKTDSVPTWISGISDKVAVRVSNHPTVIELCNELGGPLVSTSANPAGEIAAESAAAVVQYFGTKINYICEGELGGQKGASEIRDLETGALLRAAII